MICKKCGKEVAEGSVFCSFCGAKVEEEVVVCHYCGRENPTDAIFCSYCGKKIKDEPRVCLNCGKENQSDAVFCSACGTELVVQNPTVNKVKKEINTYRKVEKILTPSLLLGLIIGLFCCSFFIGSVLKISVLGSQFSGGINNVFWFFKDSFDNVAATVSSTQHLAKNEGLLKFVLYTPAVVCLIAILLNFASVITCLAVGIVRFVKGIQDNKRANLLPLAAISSASFIFAAFIILGYNYAKLTTDGVSVPTTMSAGSVTGIIFIFAFLIAAFVLKCIAEGRALANKNSIVSIVCGLTMCLFAFITVVLSRKMFEMSGNDGSTYLTGGLSSALTMRAVYMGYIDSDLSGALGARLGVLINYFDYLAFLTIICLLITFALKNIFSEKKRSGLLLAFSILGFFTGLVLMITALYTASEFVKLEQEVTSVTVGNPIVIFVLSVVIFAVSIVNIVMCGKNKSKPLYKNA